MRMMYKGNESKPVHNDQFKKMKADGWAFHKAEHVQKKAEEPAKAQETEEIKEEQVLTKTQSDALALNISIYDDDGKAIHHKKLAKLIREAKNGDED